MGINEDRARGERQISVMIPLEIYNEVKSKGFSHKEIYIQGFRARIAMPAVSDRMAELTQKIERMSSKLEYYAKRSYELEKQLEII